MKTYSFGDQPNVVYFPWLPGPILTTSCWMSGLEPETPIRSAGWIRTTDLKILLIPCALPMPELQQILY